MFAKKSIQRVRSPLLDADDHEIEQGPVGLRHWQGAPLQEAPVHTGDEEQVAAPGRPVVGRGALFARPEARPLPDARLVRRYITKDNSRRKSLHAPYVVEVVGVLEVAAGQPMVIPVEPDRPHTVSLH